MSEMTLKRATVREDIVPIIDHHSYWVIIDAASGNMEYDMLGRVLRQQR